MNKLIIKEVIEHDFTPASYPTYRKDTITETYYCIMPERIIKVYQSNYNSYCSMVCGTYNVLGNDCVSQNTIECTAEEFNAAWMRGLDCLEQSMHVISNTITNEGDE